MMYSSSNQWTLVGLTSYGTGCALPEYTGVYTRVAAFQDWINSTMNAAYIPTISLYHMFFLIFLHFFSLFLSSLN
jgi:secreted trypsin-like serine protease